jgi:glycosyltransferase involved in cell wall biosynthesis
MEANACGIPVVATRTVGSTYIMGSSDQGILCDVESVESLSQGMMDMVSRYAEFRPDRIEAVAASRFNADLVLGEWIKLYKEVSDV